MCKSTNTPLYTYVTGDTRYNFESKKHYRILGKFIQERVTHKRINLFLSLPITMKIVITVG